MMLTGKATSLIKEGFPIYSSMETAPNLRIKKKSKIKIFHFI